jgi:hypothetical protein
MPVKSAARSRTQTDADLAQITADAVAGAVEFTATIRAADPDHRGRTRNFTVRRATLAEARAMAARLENLFHNGRRALVYAISANAMSYMVPNDFIQTEETNR